MNIGERIKDKRTELNMSQDELAKKVGYKSRSSIQKIEASRDLPLNKVTKMANALGCTEAYLMGWEDEDNGIIIEKKSRDTEQAIRLYQAYLKAIPQVREAVERLLKSDLSDS
jgi:transcriptional regulator with XRE-family HTH domain